jgi:DNA mismatch endonuclease, patch repair protein
MADRLSPAERSRNMAGIRGKDTIPERTLRSGLHRSGLRFRLHCRALPGRPDLVFAKYRTAVFVHGCFWHRHPGCGFAYQPKSRKKFWRNKFDANVTRDRRQIENLLGAGWRVIVVWECALRKNSLAVQATKQVIEWLRSTRCRGEIPGKESVLRRASSAVGASVGGRPVKV